MYLSLTRVAMPLKHMTKQRNYDQIIYVNPAFFEQ